MPEASAFPDTAIPSWSGYVYQGKVAIYHVIKTLCERPQEDCYLQLDSLEDFALLKKENEIISLHQVKAHAKGPFSGYNDSAGNSAFEKLKNRASEYGCDRAFFHLANEITNKPISEIESEFSPVKVYKYEERYECPVDGIDSKIEEQVRKYFSEHSPEPEKSWRCDSAYIQKVKVFLFELVHDRVLKIHAMGQKSKGSMAAVAFREKINLTEFTSILNANLSQSGDAKYFLYLIRMDFRRYYLEFCEKFSDSELCKKMASYFETIEKLDTKSIVTFIQNITPHREIKFDSITDYHNHTLIQSEVQGAFFKILAELKQLDFKEAKSVFECLSASERYYPTAIQAGPSHDAAICEKIIQNALRTDLGLSYERDNLITTDIKVDSITDKAPHVLDTAKNDSQKASEYNRITLWKKIALIPLAEAKGIINA